MALNLYKKFEILLMKCLNVITFMKLVLLFFTESITYSKIIKTLICKMIITKFCNFYTKDATYWEGKNGWL